MAEKLIYKASPPASVPRLSLLHRAQADERPPMRLTHRDLAIIEAVYAYRALTTPQIERLLFPGDERQFQAQAKQPASGKSNRCRHRLKLLFHHGYLHREELPTPLMMGRRPLIYFLDSEGREALCRHYGLSPQDIDWHPRHNTVGSRFLEHLLKTNDVRVAVTLGAQRRGFILASWLDDHILRKQQNRDHVYLASPQTGKRRKVALVPDGYFHLKTEGYEFHFLLEIDRRTVVGQYARWGGKDWARKVRAYIAYFTPQPEGQLSLFEQRFGTPNLRVLTITTGPTRLKNLKRITEQAGGRGRFWFTTFEAITSDTVLTDPIWFKAGQPGLHCLAV